MLQHDQLHECAWTVSQLQDVTQCSHSFLALFVVLHLSAGIHLQWEVASQRAPILEMKRRSWGASLGWETQKGWLHAIVESARDRVVVFLLYTVVLIDFLCELFHNKFLALLAEAVASSSQETPFTFPFWIEQGLPTIIILNLWNEQQQIKKFLEKASGQMTFSRPGDLKGPWPWQGQGTCRSYKALCI